jgi:hypothetical protein
MLAATGLDRTFCCNAKLLISSGACSARKLSTPTVSQARLPTIPRSVLPAWTSWIRPVSKAIWCFRQPLSTTIVIVPCESRSTALTNARASLASRIGLAIVSTNGFAAAGWLPALSAPEAPQATGTAHPAAHTANKTTCLNLVIARLRSLKFDGHDATFAGGVRATGTAL